MMYPPISSHLSFTVAQIGVLQWFAKLWEIDSEDFWGYITNCGTEGNLHGILVGRENHPDGMQQRAQALSTHLLYTFSKLGCYSHIVVMCIGLHNSCGCMYACACIRHSFYGWPSSCRHLPVATFAQHVPVCCLGLCCHQRHCNVSREIITCNCNMIEGLHLDCTILFMLSCFC